VDIALSLPDNIVKEAEETAHYLGISSSTLYLNALVEFLDKNNRKKITEKLNEVYATDDYYKELEPFAHAGLESIREIIKDDSW
jgi:hypothetical protein